MSNFKFLHGEYLTGDLSKEDVTSYMKDYGQTSEPIKTGRKALMVRRDVVIKKEPTCKYNLEEGVEYVLGQIKKGEKKSKLSIKGYNIIAYTIGTQKLKRIDIRESD